MCLQPHLPSLHIAGPAWSPQIDYILHPSPEPSRQSPGAPGKRLLMRWGMVPVSPTGTRGSFPRMISTRELISCSRARKGPWIGPGTDKFQPASLKHINKYNTYNWYNAYNWYNNYHSQECHTFPSLIQVYIQRTGSNVSHSRCKTKAYQTVSGDTTKEPLSIPGGLIITMSKWWLLW